MNPISAAEMLSIQNDIAAAACDKDCQIQRLPSNTPTNRGVPAGNYSTIATVKAAMTQPTSTHLENYAYAIEALATWLVKLPVGTDVKAGDHLVIDGQTLDVQVILDPHSYAGLLPVLASELKK